MRAPNQVSADPVHKNGLSGWLLRRVNNAEVSCYAWRKKALTALSLELKNGERMEHRTYTRREVVKGGTAALLGASLTLP